MTPYLSAKFRLLSFVSIVAVVYVHAYNLTDRYLLPWTLSTDPLTATAFIQMFVSNGLTRFAVPIFFAISGFLFFRKFEPDLLWFADQFGKRLRSLAIPYFLWSTIGLALVWFLQRNEMTRPAVDTWDLFPPDVRFDLLFFRWVINPVPFQLWFVRDLLLYAVLSPLLYLGLRYLGAWLLLPVGLLWFVHANFVILEGEGLLFFLLGSYFAIHRKPMPVGSPRWLPPVTLVLWLGVLTAKTLLVYSSTAPLPLILLHKTAILFGVATVWFGYDLFGEAFGETSFAQSAAPFSTFIYFAHEPLLNHLSNFALRQWNTDPLTVYVTYPLLTTLLCMAIGATIRSFLPPVYSWLTGGRGF
ncbi:MAG: acyltransferase family protein [Capsulimonadales bacterium]|nr:acyltransferase family protein [Capsulimonadales bacterium]